MYWKWIVTVVAAFAMAGTVATASAAPQGRGHGARMFGGIPAGRLGLTDAQQQQLKSVAQAHRDETIAMRQRLGAAKSALRDATATPPVDEALVRQRSADLAAAKSDAAVLHGRVRAEMMQVLTPDQQAQLKSLQSSGRNRKRRRT